MPFLSGQPFHVRSIEPHVSISPLDELGDTRRDLKQMARDPVSPPLIQKTPKPSPHYRRRITYASCQASLLSFRLFGFFLGKGGFWTFCWRGGVGEIKGGSFLVLSL